MNPFLLLDADRSLASIGGAAGCEQRLGAAPIPITDIDSIFQVFRHLLAKERVQLAHEMFPGMTREETRITVNEQARELGLDGLIIDTLSRVATYEMETITRENEADQMRKRDWGLLKDRFTRLINTISRLEDLTIIVNTHVRREKDEIGAVLEQPQIPGSMRDEIGGWFDLILHTRVKSRPSGESAFFWQVSPTERRFAKDRLGVLEPDNEGLIAQDYSYLLRAYADQGVPHPKILVVGETGTGKTRSLATINQEEEEPSAQPLSTRSLNGN